MLDNFTSRAPHEQQEDLDRSEVVVLYAICSVILLMVGTAALVWWL